jgi:S-adenosylmethionine-diacylgycerolhomoserine-N-methlytransferase
MNTAQAMDRMYRYQRYIYDLSRKYFLFGRDTLIQRMDLQQTQHVLEVGCGTGRNLYLLAKRHPQVQFFGLDASQAMLETAANKLKAQSNIHLQQGLAQEIHYHNAFQLKQPFDVVFFSYALSMIPEWTEALHCALDNLKPQGDLYIVDFSDQRTLPHWFRKLLQSWLVRFGVQHDPALPAYLQTLHEQGRGKLELDNLKGRYAFIAHFRKSGEA